jgi:hypothetical protein
MAEMIGWHEFPNDENISPAKTRAALAMNEQHINLRRVFHEPREFDLVSRRMAAAVPYAEKGPRYRPDLAAAAADLRGQFIGFAFWFN